MLDALIAAVMTFLRAVGRAIRQLFFEVTGAFFALFAVLGGIAVWRAWQREAPGLVIALAAVFTILMVRFAVSEFRRAWKS